MSTKGPKPKQRWRKTKRLLAVLLVLAALIVGFLLYCVAMPGSPFDGTPPALTKSEEAVMERLRGYVKHLAIKIGVRHIGRYEQLVKARDFIRAEFEAMGYTVARQAFTAGGKEVSNLEVIKKGSTLAQEIIVVGAHYDTASHTPGADDNASGVAALLELARAFKQRNTKRTIRFVAFVNEEPPYFRTHDMGSYHYAQRAVREKWNITAMLSLETIGYYLDQPGSQKYPAPFSYFYSDRGNFIGVVGNLASRSLARRVVRVFREQGKIAADGVAAPAAIPGIDFSDQLNFWKVGYPAVMVTDTAMFRNPNYHEPTDLPQTLNYPQLYRVFAGLDGVVLNLANDD